MISCKSNLGEEIQAFIVSRRALGRRYESEERTLSLLDRFLAERRVATADDVSPTIIEEFLRSRPRAKPRSYNHLLSVVRGFFDWLVRQGRLRRSPVQAKVRRNTNPRMPFIFDPPTAARLLETAANLRDNPRATMRGITYHTIFAVLYCLGLRVGEAARLLVGDIDWDRHLLLIRETKFYKSRLVPFGPRLGEVLKNYVEATRVRRGILSMQDPLFSFTANRTINPCTISQAFHGLVPKLNLVIPSGVGSPRVHDLRHSFAVGTLLRWYRTGQDPGARLLHLSTFLGHVDISSTAVYLTMTTSLLEEANRRFEAHAKPLIQEGFVP